MMEEQSVVRALEGQTIADAVVRHEVAHLDDPLTDLLARAWLWCNPSLSQAMDVSGTIDRRPLALSARLLAPRPMDRRRMWSVK